MRVIAPPTTSLAPVLILRDGSVAAVRAGGPADHDTVREFFRQLSPESRYRRFFSAAEPSDDVIDRLIPTDPAHGVTLLAMRFVDGHERLLGMVSYIPISDTIAEVAFAVDEGYGRQGIATSLLERLAVQASHAGFESFRASTLSENGPCSTCSVIPGS